MAKRQIRDYVFTPGISGSGNVKVLDKILKNEILMITNVTQNKILYNFADPTNPVIVEFTPGNSVEFPYASSISNGVTTIHFQFDTSDQDQTDSLSIFVEEEEVKFRPYNFGTDAVERMRVATPQSMIDADFEYGIQPTKWQTIDHLRGYPSTFEIPGSDISVLEIQTDASSPTGGFGASLITVQTNEPHGFSVGQPFRIFGLLETVSGSSRAEGSFLVQTVLNPNTFTYFAKGKVGTGNPTESLYATYSQLRRGGFYTGAAIGSPTYSLLTNGVTGSFISKFITRSGSNRLAYTGVNNVIVGSPLTASGLLGGTQVTGITTTSATTSLSGNVTAPSNTLAVASITGIQVGSALDDGTGNSTFVTNIDGNTLTLSTPYLVNGVGGQSIVGILSASPSNFNSGGSATFNVDRTQGRYLVNLNSPGVQYNDGQRLIIPGTSLGGTSDNDLIIRVRGVDPGTSGITTFTTVKSVTTLGDASINQSQKAFGVSSLLLNPTSGSSADSVMIDSNIDFDISTSDFTLETWIYRNRVSTQEILIDMRTSEPMIAPMLRITSGDVLSYYVDGAERILGTTSIPANTWVHVAVSRTGTSTRLYLNGVQEGSTYNDTNSYVQSQVKVGNSFNGLLGFFGYVDTTRLSIGISRYTSSSFTVPSVEIDPLGSPFYLDEYTRLLLLYNGSTNQVIIADSAYGIAIPSYRTYTDVTGVTNGFGAGAVFDVYRTGTPTYTVTFKPGQVITGLGYAPNDTITVNGTILGGSSGTNDLTITVTTVDGNGRITSFTSSGTAFSGNATFTGLSGTLTGDGALFNITKSIGSYNVSIDSPGSGYFTGYQLKILGTLLGGTSPTNDLTITINRTIPDNSTRGRISSVIASGTPSTGTVLNFFPSVSLSELTTSPIADAASISHSSLARFEVTFANVHGLVPGDTITSTVTSAGAGHSLASGPFVIDSVPELNKIRFNARTTGSVTAAGLAGTVYPRPDCFYVHRPFDGGVQLGVGGPSHGAHAVRQSKKYIRYQSGKGVMYTTGALFAPSYDLRSVSATGTSIGSLITMTTDDTEHGLQVGAEVQISNVTSPGYNGHYTVNSVINENTFTVLATNVLSTTQPILGRPPSVSLYKWKGATVRAGAFDDQNGIFWQYDGNSLSVGLRSATFQLAGTISATPDSNFVSGANTRFVDQLIVGDRIVIRGMTHVVTSIIGDNGITVSPDFRGVTSISGAKATLVQDTIIPQYQWNIDRADGTGASGYEIEINKMQMIGFQYTWYGAGFIDWMLRGPDGNYLFVHRLKNNNKNTEAYMRSGNLPVRYEVINEGPKTSLASNITNSQTSIPLLDASLYPNTGTIYVDNELINYTGKSGNTLTGVTRSATFGNYSSGSFRNYTAGLAASHTQGTGAILLSNTATPVISHWGSAFLTDGLFDSDRGYIFNYPYVGGTVSTTKTTTFMIRLAPSVSNAITGDLGQRELINRAQLLLKSLEFTPTGGSTSQAVIIEGILNPSNYPSNPASVQWFTLTSQGAGGQPSFAQIANASSITWEGGAQTINATTAEVQNYFTQYQVFTATDVANVRIGFFVSGSGVPGGTRVINIFRRDANRNYVQFSNSVNSGPSGTTYTFTSNTVSAAPGETVFSFVGAATEKSTIDLSELKELNNTPIGGRGTFPNGPDVLAINVYLTTGANITGNLVLRWAEAQA
jgi:hypothetical protein